MRKIKFNITNNDSKRTSEFYFDNIKIRSPIFFPVLSFFGGATEKKLFGGGIYRKIKEILVRDENVKNMFKFVLTSVSQFLDFNISERKMEFYLQKTIKEWFNLNSIIFVDSGGFKLLTKNSYKKDFFEQDKIFKIQLKMGADIIVPLDYPLDGNTNIEERKNRLLFTIKNAIRLIELLENSKPSIIAYLPIHGHSEEEVKFYISEFLKELERAGLKNIYKGIAIGSLVPHAINGKKLIDIIIVTKKILEEYSMDKMPIHVFGISSSLIVPLSLLVDSFDSSSYLMAGIYGEIFDSCFRRVHVGENGWEKVYKQTYIGSTYPPERATYALHNLEIIYRELEFIREAEIHEIKKKYEKNRKIVKLLEYVEKKGNEMGRCNSILKYVRREN